MVGLFYEMVRKKRKGFFLMYEITGLDKLIYDKKCRLA